MRGANGDGGPWGGLPEPYRWDDWTVGDLVRLKEAAGTRVSLVIPARDEAATIGDIVKRLRAELVERYRLLDQLIVIDSDSTDGTLVAARDAGALVYRASDIRPDLGSHPGKGEALWKSQFVASGDLLVFIDADLLDWDTHFVSGLLGPLLTDAATMLVKGFYQRPFLADGGPSEPSGGRVTELVARPLIALEFPSSPASCSRWRGNGRRGAITSPHCPFRRGTGWSSPLWSTPPPLTGRGRSPRWTSAIGRIDIKASLPSARWPPKCWARRRDGHDHRPTSATMSIWCSSAGRTPTGESSPSSSDRPRARPGRGRWPMLPRVIGPTLEIHGRVRSIDTTLVMGVVNASPESFSDGGRHGSLAAQLELCAGLVESGADVIDIGGQSAVTNQAELEASIEAARVVPIVEWVRSEHPDVLVSVDTYKPAVVESVLRAGAHIINDVSGLRYPVVAEQCAEHGAALVIMHTAAPPKVRRQEPGLYADVATEVVDFLTERTGVAMERGLSWQSVILDPGPDFTKTPAQTVRVLRRLAEVRAIGRPVLLALSRKDFLGAITGRTPRRRDAATAAAIAYLATEAGGVVRVHDVAAAVDVIATIETLMGIREIPDDYVLPDELRYEPRPT